MHCFNDLMNLVDLYIIIIHWPSHLLAFVPLDVTDPVPTGKEPHQSFSQSLLALNVSLTTFLSFFSCFFYDNSFIIIIFSFICHKNLKKSNLIFHIDNNNINGQKHVPVYKHILIFYYMYKSFSRYEFEYYL